MFNKKEFAELKEEFNSKFSELHSQFNSRIVEQNKFLKEFAVAFAELQQTNGLSAEKIKKDLEEVNSIRQSFETTLNRLNSVSKNIEETAAMNVKEVAEKELESIKASSKQFRGIENEMKSILENVNSLQLEISKFLSISHQIKLVDFTLKRHEEDLSSSERERMALRNENEELKSIMARMKRNKY
jgi:methyl-accepting chemotaxis protein